MCTVLLPPGVNPIAVNKYINININFEPDMLSRPSTGHRRITITEMYYMPRKPTNRALNL